MDKTIEEILNPTLINPDSADEIWTTLRSLGMEEVEDYLRILNCNMYETIDRGTSRKLSFKEIALTFDPLNELLKGNTPSFSWRIDRTERIKIQIRYMNENRLCTNLTDEEKLFFAYCVYLMTCTNRFIDGNILYGITEFTSYEKIVDFYNQAKKDFPEWFDLSYSQQITGKYGYTPENPIRTTSISSAYRLIDKLRYKNERVTIKDRYSVSTDNTSHIIDKFILVTSGGSRVTIYVDSYCADNSDELPEDFSLSE